MVVKTDTVYSEAVDVQTLSKINATFYATMKNGARKQKNDTGK